MRNFNKILLAFVLWLLTIILLSAVVMGPFMYLESHYYGDKEAASSMDTVICGSSQGQQSFMPTVISSELGVNAYNISSTAMTIHGRRELLDAYASDFTFKNVIIEISADSLLRSPDFLEGDMTLVPRFKNPLRQIRFISEYLSFEDLDDIYAYYLFQGIDTYKRILTHQINNTKKGFHGNSTGDMTIPEEQCQSLLNMTRFDASNVDQIQLDELDQLIAYCEEAFDEVYVVVVPVSDAFIWKNDGWDEVLTLLKTRCEAHGLHYADFNLSKNRNELYSDKTSFCNEDHMSTSGAEVFTYTFCDYVKRMEAGEDVSGLFYNDYDELKQHLPYAANLP